MPVRKVCQTFFRDALASTHQYRQNALIDSTTALINGVTLSLTSIGCYLPGAARAIPREKLNLLFILLILIVFIFANLTL